MAAPFGSKTRGVNEAWERTPLRQPSNIQDGPRQSPFRADPLIRDAIKVNNERAAQERAFNDWARDQKLSRKSPPSVPQIPYREMRKLQLDARSIALKIIKTGTRIHPFRLILSWVFDWLFDWFTRWLLRRMRQSSWKQFGKCANPTVPMVRPNVFGPGSLNYPPSANEIHYANSCLSGQIFLKTSMVDSLEDAPDSWRNCFEVRVYSVGATSYGGQIVGSWGRPNADDLPSIWIRPDAYSRPDIADLPAPSRAFAPDLVPDWKQQIDPDRMPEVSEEPDPDSESQREPHKVVDVTPGTKTQVKTEYRYRVRTREREKEQKFQGAPQVIKSIFKEVAKRKEQITEADDFLDTLFEALPKEVQERYKGRKTPQGKAKAIYDDFDKIDWAKWGENFVKNYLEDKAVGAAIDAADKASHKRGATNTIGGRWWLRPPR